MESLCVEHLAGGGCVVKVRFADADAQAALASHLDLLCRPADHEGPDLVPVKSGVSRTVWRCRLDGAGYYLKHYHWQSLSHRLGEVFRGTGAARAMRHSLALSEAGVRTPVVLAIGDGPGCTWLLSRAVESATPADVWHDRRADSHDPGTIAAVRRAIGALAEMAGRMHAAGLLHRDLHSGNILLIEREGRLQPILMDLHRMVHRRRLSRRGRAKDLAILMHDRWHVTTRTQRLAFLKRYLQVSGATAELRVWAATVQHFAGAHKGKQYAARDRRVFREGKYFTALRLPGRWRGRAVLASKRRLEPTSAATMVFTAAGWQAALADPGRLFDAPDAVVVKDSPSSLVIRRALTVGEHEVDVYVKRARRTKLYKAPLDALRPSRALRAFELGHALLTRRIATALPLAAVERRWGPFLRDSILITEAVVPDEPLGRFLDRLAGGETGGGEGIESARQGHLAQETLLQLGRTVQRLQSEGFAHRDLKAANLLVYVRQDRPPQIVLVDLDGLSRSRHISQRRRFQGLMRLNVSLLECASVSHAGRLRMLLGYLRHPGSGRIHFKPYWRELERWSDEKLRQQIAGRRKRQRKLRR